MLRLAAASLALLALAAEARADPIVFVEQRENYMIFDDVDGTVEHANWFGRESFYAAYYPIEAGFLAAHPDDSDFLVIYSTFDLVQGVGAFYQSLANDVQGIGYAQAAELDPIIPAEIFDDTPDSRLLGVMHMNNWRRFLLPGGGALNDTWISLAFGQELGHAWLAFTHVDQGAGPSDLLLGRAGAHWSFYMHSKGSPLEGQRWTDHGDGSFTAAKLTSFEFNDLDLYLMGLMPPEEVQPWFVIEDPHDCVDSNLAGMACPPPGAFGFQADSFTIKGTRRDVTIDDVIAAEGPRVPAYPDAPSEFGLSFILIKRPDETLCAEELARIDAIVARSIEMWVGQTRGRASLDNRTRAPGLVGPGPACAAETSSSGDGTGDPPDPTGGAGEAPATGTSGATEGATSGGADTDAGCACRSTRGAGAPLLLALAGLARRRRPRARRGPPSSRTGP